MQDIRKISDLDFLKIIFPENVLSKKVKDYIDKATELNMTYSFEFYYPLNININYNIISKIVNFKNLLLNIDFLEKDTNNYCFSIVPVPYKKVKRGKAGCDKLSDIDFASLGTSGRNIDNNFLRIFSNWQLDEVEHERYLTETIQPGWYIFCRGTIKDFCGLSFEEQLIKLRNHKLSDFIRQIRNNKINKNTDNNSLIPEVQLAHSVGCIESLTVEKIQDLPIRRGFLRTSTLYYSGARMGILGSAYGFDIDGFWAGEGAGSNISLAFCEILEKF